MPLGKWFFTYTGFYDNWDVTSAGGVIYLYAIDFDMTRKSLLLAQITVAIGLVVASIFTAIKASYSQSRAPGVFFCGTDKDGTPATIVHHPQRGEVVFIRWVSEAFSSSGYTPRKRCEEASRRFQISQQNGTLNYIVSGVVNGQQVVCASESIRGVCNELLFTLVPGSYPKGVIGHLILINTARIYDPLEQ